MIELTTEQQEAIEKIDQDMLVTAGAGSGKTLVLVRRFVKILEKQPQHSVRNLLAVTYTRKAAKEMRTRIKSCLKELYEETKKDAGTSKHNWQQSLSEMDAAHIETIHSLCQTILRSFAVHAGVDAHIELLEDVELAQVIEETIEEALRQAIALREDDYPLLTHFSPGDIKDILQMVLKNHLQFSLLAEQLRKLAADDLQKELDQLLTGMHKQFLVDLSLDPQWRAAANYIANTIFSDPSSELEKIRLYATNLSNLVGVDCIDPRARATSPYEKLIQLSQLQKPGNRGGRGEPAVELRKNINVLIDKARECTSKLPATTQNTDNQYWQLWQAFLFMANRALNIYKNKKQQLQKLDYDDLIAKASEILGRKDSPVRRHYNEAFSHILVDEFQDTNSVQANLIKMLAEPQTKLFFIGDDKQSIYKFQGADLAAFNTLRKEMNDDKAFEHSFRSTPAIVNFVNGIFTHLLHADFAHVDYRAKYRPLKAKRDAAHQTENVEVIQLPVVDRNHQTANAPPERTIEGLAVANWIKAKVDQEAPVWDKSGSSRPINYGDFAILVPGNNDFQYLESSLSQYGIPYVTSGGKTFLQRQEIYDLENMLLFLSNPSDSHALLGILRSPMFAFSDDLIHQLAVPRSERNHIEEPVGAKFMSPRVDSIDPCNDDRRIENPRGRGALHAPVLWQSLQNEAAKKGPDSQLITDAVNTLKRLLSDLHILALPQLIYKIIRETNYDLTVLSLPDGKQRYKNIWKFHTLAGQRREISVGEFTEYINLSRQLSVDLSNAPVDSGHAIKLMTIHAAKGLEFPAVALPRLSARGRQKENKMLFHQQFGIALDTTRGSFRSTEERDENTPPAYRLSRVLNKDMEIAEKKRLLYVAMTRARDYLGIFIKESEKKGEHAANWLRPLIDPANIRQIDLESLRAGALTGAPAISLENVALNGRMQCAPTITNQSHDDQIHDHLLEPHIAVGTALRELELMPRITPGSQINIEPDHSLVGTYFHKIMEFLPLGKTILSEEELYALIGQMEEEKLAAAAHPRMARALVEHGKKLLAIFAGSELNVLMSTAKTICHEWSYYIVERERRDPKRRPDLLLEAADGTWYVIDYKTDNFPVADIEQQASRHRPQLERYGKDFTALTGITPQLAIYFAQPGQLHKLRPIS